MTQKKEDRNQWQVLSFKFWIYHKMLFLHLKVNEIKSKIIMKQIIQSVFFVFFEHFICICCTVYNKKPTV